VAFQYVGEELRLFQHALNWKAYLRDQLAAFIRGDVLEVGAGVGATTIALHDDRCSSWTCLEPDRGLAQELERSVAALKDRRGMPPQAACTTSSDLDPTLRYDSILYVDVLEHIRDDREELQ
jgi:2-polyprenyl-3-methyl-5-hydroxy-6-metoxy-1,4-benzoquinol methylase